MLILVGLIDFDDVGVIQVFHDFYLVGELLGVLDGLLHYSLDGSPCIFLGFQFCLVYYAIGSPTQRLNYEKTYLWVEIVVVGDFVLSALDEERPVKSEVFAIHQLNMDFKNYEISKPFISLPNIHIYSLKSLSSINLHPSSGSFLFLMLKAFLCIECLIAYHYRFSRDRIFGLYFLMYSCVNFFLSLNFSTIFSSNLRRDWLWLGNFR